MQKTNTISREFSIELLRAVYELDEKLGDINDIVCGEVDGELLTRYEYIMREVMILIGSRLMLPMYLEHNDLGRLLEPGDWYVNKNHLGLIYRSRLADKTKKDQQRIIKPQFNVKNHSMLFDEALRKLNLAVDNDSLSALAASLQDFKLLKENLDYHAKD